MFDIGGWEFLVIILVAIVVIGPKDLPAAIRTVTGWIRRARALARDFQSGLDDLARETELDSIGDDINAGLGLDEIRDAGKSIRREIEHSIDPGDEIAHAMRDDTALLAPGEAKEPPPRRAESGSADAGEAGPDGKPSADEPVPAEHDPSAATKKA